VRARVSDPRYRADFVHDEGCAYAYGNATYACSCPPPAPLVPRDALRDAIYAVSVAHDWANSVDRVDRTDEIVSEAERRGAVLVLAADVEALREFLWANHRHSDAALYGDDGEMQCKACGDRWDYLRQPIGDCIDAANEAILRSYLSEQAAPMAHTAGDG
jgi:hypothetical protein